MNSSVEPIAIWIGGSAMAPNPHIRVQYHLVRAPLPPRESQASSLGVWPIVFLLGTPNHTQNTLVLLWPTIHDTRLKCVLSVNHVTLQMRLHTALILHSNYSHCTQTLLSYLWSCYIAHISSYLQLSTAGCVGIMRKTLWCTVKPVSPSDLVIENSYQDKLKHKTYEGKDDS